MNRGCCMATVWGKWMWKDTLITLKMCMAFFFHFHSMIIASLVVQYAWHLHWRESFFISCQNISSFNCYECPQESSGVPYYWCHKRRDVWIHGRLWHDLWRIQLEAEFPLVPCSPEGDGSTQGGQNTSCQVHLRKHAILWSVFQGPLWLLTWHKNPDTNESEVHSNVRKTKRAFKVQIDVSSGLIISAVTSWL